MHRKKEDYIDFIYNITDDVKNESRGWGHRAGKGGEGERERERGGGRREKGEEREEERERGKERERRDTKRRTEHCLHTILHNLHI